MQSAKQPQRQGGKEYRIPGGGAALKYFRRHGKEDEERKHRLGRAPRPGSRDAKESDAGF